LPWWTRLVDEFGDNGLKFSICQPDFSASMTAIGNAIVRSIGEMSNFVDTE
jgi:hypothetical protein